MLRKHGSVCGTGLILQHDHKFGPAAAGDKGVIHVCDTQHPLDTFTNIHERAVPAFATMGHIDMPEAGQPNRQHGARQRPFHKSLARSLAGGETGDPVALRMPR